MRRATLRASPPSCRDVPSFFSTPGRISATNTKAAVTSLRSFGLSPPLSAIATSRRKRTEPSTAPVMMNPSCRTPTSASPMMMLARPHTIIPIPICTSANPWYCASRAPATAMRPFESRQAEHDHVVHVHAERADHLRVVAGRLHRGAEVRLEEGIEQRAWHLRPRTAPRPASRHRAARRSSPRR